MHPLQEKLLRLAATQNLAGLTLRQIGKLVAEKHPQKVKHHLEQLEKKGLIALNREKGVLRRIAQDTATRKDLLTIPILGSADCGRAQFFADANIQGYLKVSRKVVKPKPGLFALRAVGHSMNRANVKGRSIDDGDYVIIDKNAEVKDKDYIVSIIDGLCNIKRLAKDTRNQRIILISESNREFPPIVIHPEETSYFINGRVVEVIKKPQI
ncbi:MAG: S24 family peptidase [Blastocatellia bacterium]